ncbi:MAG: bifunctional nuclease family protein [Ignavibacteriae bacterium]|nr:bifunctional nuclease family protein [Ignavibacteriota bacterium]
MKDKIQVEVLGLSQSPTSNGSYALILKEVDGDRRLPIVIGAPEAGAIAYEMEGVHTSRPMTHDLIKSIIETFDTKVTEIFIHEMKDSTFYASLHFYGIESVVDARPSDAIAVALRFEAPMYIASSLLDLAGFSLEEYEGKDDEDDDSDELDIEDTEEEEIDFFLKDGAQKKRPSTSLSKKERLEAELEQAIKDEDYEKAAQLRDEIEGLK